MGTASSLWSLLRCPRQPASYARASGAEATVATGCAWTPSRTTCRARRRAACRCGKGVVAVDPEADPARHAALRAGVREGGRRRRRRRRSRAASSTSGCRADGGRAEVGPQDASSSPSTAKLGLATAVGRVRYKLRRGPCFASRCRGGRLAAAVAASATATADSCAGSAARVSRARSSARSRRRASTASRRPRSRSTSRTGQVVFRGQRGAAPSLPHRPRSSTVSFAALRLLGPGFRFRTEVLGAGELVGQRLARRSLSRRPRRPDARASPTSTRLARDVKAWGIRRVTGRVVGDERHFDARRAAPGWKPWFLGIESPPLSALVVDGVAGRGREQLGGGGRDARSPPRSRAAASPSPGSAAAGRAPADVLPLARRPLGAAQRDRPAHEPRERQLRLRDAPQGARGERGAAAARPRAGARRRAPGARATRASRSPACASSTARGSRASTG